MVVGIVWCSVAVQSLFCVDRFLWSSAQSAGVDYGPEHYWNVAVDGFHFVHNDYASSVWLLCNSNSLRTIDHLQDIVQLERRYVLFLEDKLWHNFHLLNSVRLSSFQVVFQEMVAVMVDMMMLGVEYSIFIEV